MQFVLLGISLFLVVMLVGRLLMSASPAALARVIKFSAVVLGSVVVVFLAATGRLGVAIAIAFMLLPMLMRWRGMAQRLKTAAGPTPGQSSGVRTAFLEATLDHDTGEMDARITDGPLAGRMLSELSLDELRELISVWRHTDPQSAALVEAFLDRTYGPEWRQGADGHAGGGHPGGASSDGHGAHRESRGGRNGGRPDAGRMTLEEARAALGLAENPTRAEIKDAHRRLMKRFHPDQGGTDYLAAKLNEAKEILLEYAHD
jgi:hypothetical protein